MFHQSAAAANPVRDQPDEGRSILIENAVDKDNYAVFTLDRFATLVWKTPPTLPGVLDCRRVFEIMRDQAVGKFGYLAIVEPNAGSSMPADVRAALSAMLKEHQRHIAASAIVFEGTGFGASIVRSVVSAINLATRIEFPSKVESTLYAGATWLTNQTRKTSQVSAPSLTNSVNRFRSRWNPAASAAVIRRS